MTVDLGMKEIDKNLLKYGEGRHLQRGSPPLLVLGTISSLCHGEVKSCQWRQVWIISGTDTSSSGVQLETGSSQDNRIKKEEKTHVFMLLQLKSR